MSLIDYAIGLAALALILWNMRRKELTDRTLLRPILVAGGIALGFLHTVPTAGADGVLVALGLATGIACGLVGAIATRIERDATGKVFAAGTPLAIAVTAGAFLARMAFAFAATHGLGPAIARFSSDVGIHSAQAWVASLILMAVADLATRALVLWRRRDQSRALWAGGYVTVPSAATTANAGRS
jgi:hypothetical protein